MQSDRLSRSRSVGFGALVVLVFTMIVSAAPAQAETPAQFMQRVANDLLAASRSGSEADFATAIRSHADVPTIGLAALGSYATVLPKTDRPAYYNGMITFISRYAAKESPKYPVAKAIMVGQTKETSGGAFVDSTITLKTGETYDVRWHIVKRGSAYKVREAEIIGFEMTSFLNTLFQNYISENGGNPRTLVIALNR
jgi:phospholipid transport system substrate-binding protein